MKRICVVTGSRAEFGLLRPLISRINDDPELELNLFVTGTHLSRSFGMTKNEIIDAGFVIDKEIPVLTDRDDSLGTSQAIGLGVQAFGKAFDEKKPDLVVVLGDRFEILSAVLSAYTLGISVAHLHGGELTEGCVDDGYRHSITKMSALHFVSTEEYKNRVIQLGEQPDTVFNVGALGLVSVDEVERMSREELEKDLGLKFKEKNILITYHPVTLESNETRSHINELLDALKDQKDTLLIFTKANADAGGRLVNQCIEEFVKENKDNARLYDSLGQKRYFSIIENVDVVLGNSSSGLIEVPSFKKVTINIGKRQDGRTRADSVIDCAESKEEIKNALRCAGSKSWRSSLEKLSNPYRQANTIDVIISVIKERVGKIPKIKKFHDL